MSHGLKNVRNVGKLYNSFSLIEILLSIALSTTILFSVVALYSQMYKKNNYILEQTNLQIQTHQILEYIKFHLQNSGYLGPERNKNNYADFFTKNNNLHITSNCMLFFYDANKNGYIDSSHKSDPQEVFGFKFNNREIYFYKLESKNIFDNSDYLKQKNLSCRTKDNWESMTKDFSFEINNLNFTKLANNLIQIEIELNSRKYPKTSYKITSYTYLFNGNE